MHRIQNYESLARSPARRDMLDIVEAGLTAIDTRHIIQQSISRDGDTLRILDHTYDLAKFRRIHVIGFGKASCQAAAELERILQDRLFGGVAISNHPSACTVVTVCEATHPMPSAQNVTHSQSLVAYCEQISTDDLVLIIVSGGGSAMLAWPSSECDQGITLYTAANKKGLPILELNTVRKHLSSLKGGGLASLLAPARVVGLIFSDVPGATPDVVASGPTFIDHTTAEDAQHIIDMYDLGTYTLTETPKNPDIFKNVENLILLSNEAALQAMASKANSLGYATKIIASDMYDTPQEMIGRFLSSAQTHTVILGGGEARLMVSKSGTGGRNGHVALTAAQRISDGAIFASIASDGIDNGSDAGAIVDASTILRASDAGFDIQLALKEFNERPTLTATSDIVITGPTNANVSDLMALLIP